MSGTLRSRGPNVVVVLAAVVGGATVVRVLAAAEASVFVAEDPMHAANITSIDIAIGRSIAASIGVLAGEMPGRGPGLG